jgi:pyruvate dehydrogenase E2 component (dihydrolipoamide acetyltransferase)
VSGASGGSLPVMSEPPAAAPSTSAKGDTTTFEPSRARQTAARRAAEAKATIPDFTVSADVDLDAVVAAGDDVMATLIAATAVALRAYPALNATFRDHRHDRHSRINIGVALATDDGVVTPTVFDADAKDAATIAAELAELATGARAATLTAPALANATFTVWNLGEPAVRTHAPILVPGQAAALGIGGVAPRAVAVGNAVVARHTATLTLVADRRLVEPAEAAAFLAAITDRCR